MLQGIPDLEDVREQINNLDKRLNDMNSIISKTVEKRSKVQSLITSCITLSIIIGITIHHLLEYMESPFKGLSTHNRLTLS